MADGIDNAGKLQDLVDYGEKIGVDPSGFQAEADRFKRYQLLRDEAFGQQGLSDALEGLLEEAYEAAERGGDERAMGLVTDYAANVRTLMAGQARDEEEAIAQTAEAAKARFAELAEAVRDSGGNPDAPATIDALVEVLDRLADHVDAWSARGASIATLANGTAGLASELAARSAGNRLSAALASEGGAASYEGAVRGLRSLSDELAALGEARSAVSGEGVRQWARDMGKAMRENEG